MERDGPLKLSRAVSEAAEKASSAGGFLGSFLSTQKGTMKDWVKLSVGYQLIEELERRSDGREWGIENRN